MKEMQDVSIPHFERIGQLDRYLFFSDRSVPRCVRATQATSEALRHNRIVCKDSRELWRFATSISLTGCEDNVIEGPKSGNGMFPG